MSKDALLRRLYELGYDTQKIETKTQALTRLMENAISVLGEDSGEE